MNGPLDLHYFNEVHNDKDLHIRRSTGKANSAIRYSCNKMTRT